MLFKIANTVALCSWGFFVAVLLLLLLFGGEGIDSASKVSVTVNGSFVVLCEVKEAAS